MKKIVSLLMLALMVLSIMPMVSYGSYDDTKDHWAEGSIDKWTEYGVATPRSNGEFAPNELMTRGEAALLFSNLLGLNKKADLSKYKDIDKNSEYADAMAKCVAAGIFSGRSKDKMEPEASITREEFMCVYSRVITITGYKAANTAKIDMRDLGYKDANKVSDWAASCVDMMVEMGFVSGVGNNTLAPKSGIDRASVIALLDKSITTYVPEDSELTTVEAKPKGITLIVSPNVKTVTGAAEVVVVAAGAEQYNEQTGEITHNEITVESVKMPIARVQGENITVVLSGVTTTEDAAITKTGYKSEIVVGLDAKANEITVNAKDAKITVSGIVDTITVNKGAANTTIDSTLTGRLNTVENNAVNTVVEGNGTVKKVETTENITVETRNTSVENTNTEKDIVVTDKNGAESPIVNDKNTNTNSNTTVNQGGGGDSTPAHVHTYSATWTNDENQHWHETTCGHDDKGDLANHVWGTGAYAHVCSVCGYCEYEIALGTGTDVGSDTDWIYMSLASFSDYVNGTYDGTAHNCAGQIAVLLNDVDLNDEYWTPIGCMQAPAPYIYFAGIFDGNDKTIDNINIDTEALGEDPDYWPGGFFGYTWGAVIIDLTIKGKTDCAGFVGYAEYTTITDCISYVDSDWCYNISGGFVAHGDEAIVITNCINYGNFICKTSVNYCEVGGIVGRLYGGNKCSITGCKNYGNIIWCGENAGGNQRTLGGILAGVYNSSAISNPQKCIISSCTNYGVIYNKNATSGTTTTTLGGVGGIVGKPFLQSNGIGINIQNCINEGSVISSGRAGGIVGTLNEAWQNIGKYSTVSNCTNKGTIYGDTNCGQIYGVLGTNNSDPDKDNILSDNTESGSTKAFSEYIEN